jgi:hypothetical protein
MIYNFRHIVSVSVALLAGCAISPQQAATMSNFDLCDRAHSHLESGETTRIASAEIRRRGVDCETYRAAIMAHRRGMTDSMEANLRGAPSSAPLSCRTYRNSSDGTYSTTCR